MCDVHFRMIKVEFWVRNCGINSLSEFYKQCLRVTNIGFFCYKKIKMDWSQNCKAYREIWSHNFGVSCGNNFLKKLRLYLKLSIFCFHNEQMCSNYYNFKNSCKYIEMLLFKFHFREFLVNFFWIWRWWYCYSFFSSSMR